MPDHTVGGYSLRLIPVLLWMLAALLLGLAAVESSNTLYENGRWISSKTELNRSMGYAFAYILTPVTLRDNRLNLGVWAGMQEVLYYDEVPLRQVEFDCWLDVDRYVCFIFDKDPSAFRGFRFSTHSAFPSAYFTASTDGAFRSRTDVPLSNLRSDKNHVKITFHDSQAALELNGQPQGSYPCGPIRSARWGFRGSFRNVSVDNVRVQRADNGPTITESFDNFERLPRQWLRFLAVLAAFGLLGWRIGTRFLLIASWWVLLASSLVLSYVHFHYARVQPDHVRYPPYLEHLSGPPYPAEVERQVRSRYSTPPDKPRILFLGTSQTWGMGARTDDDCWVHRVQQQLGPRFECINGGMCGVESAAVLDVLRREWIRLHPRLLVVDLGNNDRDAEALAKNVAEICHVGRMNGIPTLLIPEPTCVETPATVQRDNRAALKRMAELQLIPLFDMQDWLYRHRDDGFLWWDNVHLTSFGQRLFADALVPRLRLLLKGSQ